MFNPDCRPRETGLGLIGEAKSFYKTHIHTEKNMDTFSYLWLIVAKVFNIYPPDKNHAKPTA